MEYNASKRKKASLPPCRIYEARGWRVSISQLFKQKRRRANTVTGSEWKRMTTIRISPSCSIGSWPSSAQYCWRGPPLLGGLIHDIPCSCIVSLPPPPRSTTTYHTLFVLMKSEKPVQQRDFLNLLFSACIIGALIPL